jgi:YD repeat-containing protein
VTVNDPDQGTVTYDVLDKVKTQTNAAGEVTTLSYDLLGRLTQRLEPGMTSAWTWDTATNRIGKPATASTSGGYLRTHLYDAMGRPEKVTIALGSETFTTAAEYDAASRVAKVAYPSDFAVKYSYTPTTPRPT